MGAGVRAVFVATGLKREFHKEYGPGTNNQAELLAVQLGLEKIVKDRDKANVTIYSDSQYAIGCLSNPHWRPKINVELIHQIKQLMTEFNSVTFVKVKGHSNHIGNDAADSLATKASRKRKAP
jgi:ribonuclease HI